MTLTFIILWAVGLAMDCFAVSISCGVCYEKLPIRKSLLMAFLFGAFQGLMPLIGWLIGVPLAQKIDNIDHWIIFGILLFLGIKMIYESIKDKPEGQKMDYFSIKNLLLLSIATSIDALVSGLIFAFYPQTILKAVLIIAGITFVLSLLGLKIGNYFKHRFTFNVEIFGGIILILIGTKILIEHLFF